MHYVDIHTHCRAPETGETVRLCNIFAPAYSPGEDFPGWVSVGLHPWHVNKRNMAECIDNLKSAAGDRRVVAIGEAGLDANAEASLDQQIEAFRTQIDIACQAGLPLIVHLVKALESFMAIVKDKSDFPDFVVHGFRGSPEMAEQLIAAGAHLSFGPAILNASAKLRRSVAAVPADRIFLETDDSETDISDIYREAASIRSLPLSMLQHRIQENTGRLFVKLCSE